jgi:dTMP kinase
MLADRHPDALLTREPSDGPIGKYIRQILTRQIRDGNLPHEFDWRSMALLFAADRADHVANEIAPALAEGRTVICDRYDLSSITYQLATSSDPGALAWIKSLNSKVRRPDLTIVINVTAEIAAQRRANRAGVRELFEQDDLQARLAKLYARAHELLPDPTCYVNGTSSLEETHRQVLFCLEPYRVTRTGRSA